MPKGVSCGWRLVGVENRDGVVGGKGKGKGKDADEGGQRYVEENDEKWDGTGWRMECTFIIPPPPTTKHS